MMVVPPTHLVVMCPPPGGTYCPGGVVVVRALDVEDGVQGVGDAADDIGAEGGLLQGALDVDLHQLVPFRTVTCFHTYYPYPNRAR